MYRTFILNCSLATYAFYKIISAFLSKGTNIKIKL